MKFLPETTKNLLICEFYTEEAVDHQAVIHIYMNNGHILRVPLYFHIYEDIVRFTPTIADFGVSAFKYDAMRIPVSVNVRRATNINMLYLTDVILPTDDARLDFVVG